MARSATYFEASDKLTHVRKVYAWLLAGVALTCVGATATLNLGTPIETTFNKHTVTVPPVVAIVVKHPILASFLFLGLALASGVARRTKSFQISFYVFFTAFTGVFIGPSIFVAQLAAAEGNTISGHPLRDALVLTGMTFGGLTGYVFLSKKDFSAWGSFLMTGLWVVIGAMFLSLFFGSTAFSLAISSVAVLLFAGFMVFDTWKVLNASDYDDAIGDAMNLFLDLLNFFVNLLRILGAAKK
jgi:FtsH-binding integral membrane protein